MRASGRATRVSSSELTRASRGKRISYRPCWTQPSGNCPRGNSLREISHPGILRSEIPNRPESVTIPAVAGGDSLLAQYSLPATLGVAMRAGNTQNPTTPPRRFLGGSKGLLPSIRRPHHFIQIAESDRRTAIEQTAVTTILNLEP